jgi:TRAP-type C4-dicarboxylate transport system substrate-binding protein
VTRTNAGKLPKKRGVTAISVAVTAMMITAGCAGSAGSQSDAEGFEHDADQSVVDEAVADLADLEIKYQAAAASPNENRAEDAKAFKEYVEERSGGKLTVEIIWGQAVADFSEVDDALADGRLDIAQTIPHYDPSAYPSMNAFNASLQGIDLSASPVRGDALFGVVAADLALNTESVLEDFANNDVTPVLPIMAAGNYNVICNEPGSEPSDWDGRLVRVPSQPHEKVVNALGATPTSLAFTEQYEAFQRNTIQCSVTQMNAAVDSGLLPAAPNLMVFDGSAVPSRPSTALATGINVENMPLPYRQIIFDATASTYAAWFEGIETGTAEGLAEIEENGGTVEMVSTASQETVAAEVARQRDEALQSELLGADFATRVEETTAKWESILDEVGIDDDRSFEELAADPQGLGQGDYSELADRLFDEVLASRRPS